VSYLHLLLSEVFEQLRELRTISLPSNSLHSSEQSSLLAITQPTQSPAPESSDALLLREQAAPYPWFGPTQSSARSFYALPGTSGSSPWPLGVKTGLFLVAIILVVNSTVTLWASLIFSVSGGVGVIYRGVCAQVEQAGFGLHIVINVIATLLLGASNYCMQCLTSPTRREIDRQHSSKMWLEVGILSVRNLRAIDKHRVWLSVFLAVSSFPIHLV
jgi:hypothetical protein